MSLYSHISIPTLHLEFSTCQGCSSHKGVSMFGGKVAYCKTCFQKCMMTILNPKIIKCYYCLKKKPEKEVVYIDKNKKGNIMGICGECIRDKLFSSSDFVKTLKDDFNIQVKLTQKKK